MVQALLLARPARDDAPRRGLSVADVQERFAGGRGYLAACTAGLPPRAAHAAIIADADAAARGRVDVAGYSAAAERSRAHFAALVGVSPTRVAIGSQTSVFAALVAASVPAGGEVLCVEGDFASLLLPFVHAPQGLRVRAVPLRELADSVTADTGMVVFSLVQSATGEVADERAIRAAAARHGARTFCDATQAVGWLPVEASGFDALVCHTYKWLCAPRGVAFLALSQEFERQLPALFAGWYAGADPWTSCYGHDVALAEDATRFDVSPAWQAFVGAEPALEVFAAADLDAVHDYTTGLAANFRRGLGLEIPEIASAIVTWDDPDGCDLARLTAAGITASGRAGRARVAFHVFNDDLDVEIALAALGR
ncbi:aminotransferase class V-fold PLP-dependent enzyme [Microbacterium immunditiarum]|uniref:Selenocysteine lyase/cysteine desulfurase n=1 Tax=Microbacterium immunditiarum TaxID=337480 RepID=A0A7Y9KLS0_9MICO|nr:aminotransferase class V-fold PLP-dependent enzyme [Microbacterium immunditiarum]NYE20064.1 selenocysteine lyase/cysteine desulfurase [Microbacterium immunditiarum]